jgi:hypothetical protein
VRGFSVGPSVRGHAALAVFGPGLGPVGAENPVTSRYPQVFVDQSAEAIPP